jgi:fused signal recognition particle receptor
VVEALAIAAAILVVAAIAIIPLLVGRRQRHAAGQAKRNELGREPGAGDEPLAAPAPTRTTGDAPVPPAPEEPPGVATATEEVIAPRRRFRERLGKSRAAIAQGLAGLLARGVQDEEAWEELEEALLSADVGVATTTDLVERLRARTRAARSGAAELRGLLREELLAVVGDQDRTLALDLLDEDRQPGVVLIVGVNGSGKTTTAGKLALALAEEGKQVVMAAADTFRAAATEQLVLWGERVGAQVVRHQAGADPAAVAFDGLASSRARHADVLLVDTAGRLHTKANLMEELRKVRRVLEREGGNVCEVLLVLDATTGQNGLVQARQFTQAVGVTGLVLTKLDGTAKGGIVVAVQRELGIPVKLVGLGEDAHDLAPFDPEAFVDALLADDGA